MAEILDKNKALWDTNLKTRIDKIKIFLINELELPTDISNIMGSYLEKVEVEAELGYGLEMVFA